MIHPRLILVFIKIFSEINISVHKIFLLSWCIRLFRYATTFCLTLLRDASVSFSGVRFFIPPGDLRLFEFLFLRVESRWSFLTRTVLYMKPVPLTEVRRLEVFTLSCLHTTKSGGWNTVKERPVISIYISSHSYLYINIEKTG